MYGIKSEFPAKTVVSSLFFSARLLISVSSGVCAVVIFGGDSRLARCAARRRLGRVTCLAENQHLRNQIEFCPTARTAAGFCAQGLSFAGLAGHAALRRIVRKPELTRPSIPRTSRLYRTNFSTSLSGEHTVEREPFNRRQTTEHEYESSTEDRIYRILHTICD